MTPTPSVTATLAPTASATSAPTVTPSPTPSQSPHPQCQLFFLPLDTVLVLDRSGSIVENNALGSMKTAAVGFVEMLIPLRDRVGLVTFNDEANVLSDLSSDLARITAQINDLTAEGGTDIASGLRSASALLGPDKRRPDARPVIVLLTDGQNRGDEDELRTLAAEARAHNIRIITIGLGPDINDQLLAEIAFTQADAHLAPTAAELQVIYQSIAQDLVCAGVPAQP